MEVWTDLLTIAYILLTMFMIFVAPILLLSRKILQREGYILHIFTSLGLGMFIGVATVILLVYLGYYNITNFLAVYFAVIVILYLGLYRAELKGLFSKHEFSLSGRNIFSYVSSAGRGLTQKFSAKFNKYPVAIAIVVIAIVLGFYLRLNFSLLHTALFKPDSYGHLYLVKVLSGGNLSGSQLTFNDYPRGFHAVISVIHLLTKIDAFTIMRFIGGLFGVMSIAAVYVFVSTIHNRYSGALAALIYSISLFDVTMLLRIESHATPEVLGFAVAPLFILFAYLTLVESKPNPNKSKLYLIMTMMFGALLLLIHPLTFLMMLNLTLLMAGFALAWRHNFDTKLIMVTIVILLMFIIPPMFAEYLNVINWGASPLEILSIKRLIVPSVLNSMVLLLAGAVLIYAYIERKFNLIILSSACLMFGLIYHTGILMTPIHGVARSSPFFTMSATWLVAVTCVEIMGKLDTVWYSIPVQIKILVKISQNKLKSARRIQNRWLNRMSRMRATLRTSKNYTRATQGAIFCVALYLLTFIPVTDTDYDLFEYEKNIQPTLKIVEDFPMNSTVVYSATTFMVNFNKALIEPEGQHNELKMLMLDIPANFTPTSPYTFIFIENSSSSFKIIREGWTSINSTEDLMYLVELWILEYMELNDNILLYYESPQLKIYLIYTVPLEQLIEDFGLTVAEPEEGLEENGLPTNSTRCW